MRSFSIGFKLSTMGPRCRCCSSFGHQPYRIIEDASCYTDALIFDEPLLILPLNLTFLVSQLTRQHVSVALSGDLEVMSCFVVIIVTLADLSGISLDFCQSFRVGMKFS